MRYLLVILFYLLLNSKGYSQVWWGQIRGELIMKDSLDTDFVKVIVLKKGDTVCYSSIKFDENLEYKSCNLDTGVYDLVVDMKGFHFMKINNVRVKPDAITFEDITFKKAMLNKERDKRKILEMEFTPPKVKGCG